MTPMMEWAAFRMGRMIYKRKRNLFLLALLYPLFTAFQLKFGHSLLGNLGDSLLFSVSPVFFIILLVIQWKSNDDTRLTINERRSLKYFIYSYITIHLYYCLCAINNLLGERYEWVLRHNNLIFIYILVTSLIFSIFNSHEP